MMMTMPMMTAMVTTMMTTTMPTTMLTTPVMTTTTVTTMLTTTTMVSYAVQASALALASDHRWALVPFASTSARSVPLEPQQRLEQNASAIGFKTNQRSWTKTTRAAPVLAPQRVDGAKIRAPVAIAQFRPLMKQQEATAQGGADSTATGGTKGPNMRGVTLTTRIKP